MRSRGHQQTRRSRELGSVEREEAMAALREVIQDDTVASGERRRALSILVDSKLRTPAVLDALEEAATGPGDDLREEAMRAIGEAGMPGIPRLISMLDHPEPPVRYAAAHSPFPGSSHSSRISINRGRSSPRFRPCRASAPRRSEPCGRRSPW